MVRASSLTLMASKRMASGSKARELSCSTSEWTKRNEQMERIKMRRVEMKGKFRVKVTGISLCMHDNKI